MQEFIVRANIERFRRLIAEDPVPADRDRLQALLAEEQAKLRLMEDRLEATPWQDQASAAPRNQTGRQGGAGGANA